MCDSWRSTHVPAIAIHVVTFCPSITHGLNERRASTVAEPVDRANAAEQQASANGSGLSTGGFAADGFGFSPPHRSPFSFGHMNVSAPSEIPSQSKQADPGRLAASGRLRDVKTVPVDDHPKVNVLLSLQKIARRQASLTFGR